jgi:hypothetical protein
VGWLLEWNTFLIGLAQALLPAAIVWLYYIALEPFVRRLWPQTLISWARFLGGHFADPRVGRDLTFGSLLGVVVSILLKSGRWVPAWFGLQPGLDVMPLFPMDSTASLIGAVFELQWSAIGHSIMFLFLLLLLRLVLRSVWLAACAFVPVATAYFCLPDPEPTYATWICSGLAVALFAWILVRFGLLATVTGLTVLNLLTALPITTDSSAFYFGNGLLVMGLVFAVALYGSFTSLGGRPLFRDA